MQKTPQLRLSLWEMLDDAPERTNHLPTWSSNYSQLAESVRNNIDAILNTRRAAEPIPSEYGQCENSLLTFGLPDFTDFAITSAEDRGVLAIAMEAAIRRFEPRLSSVVVTLTMPDQRNKEDQASRPTTIVRYRILGRLRLEPAPEQIAFDTVLEASRWHFEVVGER